MGGGINEVGIGWRSANWGVRRDAKIMPQTIKNNGLPAYYGGRTCCQGRLCKKVVIGIKKLESSSGPDQRDQRLLIANSYGR